MVFDFIVIGSGLAGLSFALKAEKLGSVLIISKATQKAGSTSRAQGGIASVINPNDSVSSHIQDTLTAGAGLCRLEHVKILVEQGPKAIQDLIKWGVMFSKINSQSFDLRKEGGHSKSRILHSKDITGFEIQRALTQACRQSPRIELCEDYTAIDLITNKNLKNHQSHSKENCYGVYALNKQTQKVEVLKGKATILCTGGLGQVYQYSTNDEVSTGDGMAMALRAGAELENMEFIQFHPTSLYNPGQPVFLISEALRGHGGILRNQHGEAFMESVHPLKDLAPRDIVSREIDKQIKNSGHHCVYLDMRAFSTDNLQKTFPNIFKHCLQFQLDMSKKWIPVVPAVHFSCGGIKVNHWSQTSIHNLFACGENANTGVHGANRLASNSLLEAVVFSNRAAEKIKQMNLISTQVPSVKSWDDSKVTTNFEFGLYNSALQQVQTTMWNYVGIVRTNNRLKRAQKIIQIVYQQVIEDYDSYKVSKKLIEIRNLALISLAIIQSSLLRKESRGLHYNTDYPKTRKQQKHTILGLKDILSFKTQTN